MKNRKNPKRMMKVLREKLSNPTKQRLAVLRIEANRRNKGDRIDKCYFEGVNGYSGYRSDRININHPIGIKHWTKKK